MDWYLLLMFLLGVIVGGIAMKFIFLKKDTVGDLVVVDDIKEDRPYIFLNINHEDLEALTDTNVIKLYVDRKKTKKMKRINNHLYYGSY